MQLFGKKNYKKYTDINLVKEYQKSGNKDIIAEFFDRYYHLVYGVSLKYLADRDKAQDATLEIFEKLMTDLKKHDISNFSSWLHSVTRNFCLMIIRKSKKELASQENYKSDMWIVQDEDELEKIKIKDIQLQLLEEALEDLNPEQQRCISLFYLQGKCYKEIEDITGFTNKQVKTYIQNGKRNLKQKIIKSNGIAV